jgi:putrescine transport system ATP-binding protein
MSLATRIGIMNEGKIVQIGEPREIYENPSSRYVAKIVGSINIFSGHIAKSSNGTFTFTSDELGLPIKTEPTDIPENQKTWFAIRPEKIRLTRQKPKGDFYAIKGMVEEVIYLGDNSLYRLVLGNGHHIMVSRPNSERGQKGEISWDETAYAVWPANAGSVLFS